MLLRNLLLSHLCLCLALGSTLENEEEICWDPELSFWMDETRTPRKLRQQDRHATEAIMAQIRQQAAVNKLIEDSSSDTNIPYTSTEDVKAQIRREALWHVAQTMGVPPHETETPNPSNQDHLVEEEKVYSAAAAKSAENVVDHANQRSDTDDHISNFASTHSEDSRNPSASESTKDAVDDDKENTTTSPRLTTTNDEVNSKTPAENLFTSNVTDERTMLDIFGEKAKEFLTRKVVRDVTTPSHPWLTTLSQIPETDTECRWDWRTIRCEPSCQCQFQPHRGDYHMGRSCRKQAVIEAHCVPRRPWNDHAAARRLGSLAHQTTLLLRDKIIQTIREIGSHAKSHYEKVQDRVCPPMPCVSKTLPEVILCHRSCDEDETNDEDLRFTGHRTTLLTRLQNRFAFDPQRPTDDSGWEF